MSCTKACQNLSNVGKGLLMEILNTHNIIKNDEDYQKRYNINIGSTYLNLLTYIDI